MTRYRALKALLTTLSEDVASDPKPLLTETGIGIYVLAPWRGLEAVWVQRDRVTFWLDKTTHVDASGSTLPTDLADLARSIWLESSTEYADVEAIWQGYSGTG